MSARTARVERETSESKVLVEVDLDGTGRHDISTGVGFYDHMLTAFARHSLVDLTVQTSGDTHIDAHHTVEDTAIVLGQALRQALGDKVGIRRFGDATVPLDEALVQAVVDVSGRPTACTPASPRARSTSPWAVAPATARLPRLADPSRLRDHRVPRPHRAARPRAVGPRAAPRRGDAVQGVRPGVPRRGRARPSRDRRALDQGRAIATNVVVLDYGSGNLRSAVRAVERAGASVTLTGDFDTALDADGLLVPGVGAYAACMRGLRAIKGERIIGRRLAGGRPVLGICVGMQVLFERGVEHGVETEGCDEWPGVVERLRAPVVPHMGWNTVEVPAGIRLFEGVEDERFYFVHSYGVRDWDPRDQRPHAGPAGHLGGARRRPLRGGRRERSAVGHAVPPREVR